MTRRGPRRGRWWSAAVLGLPLWSIGCAGGGGVPSSPAVRVAARGFAGGTARARYFLSGDGIVDWNVGGVETSGAPTFPHRFPRLPEGSKEIQAVGYEEIVPAAPNPTEFPAGLVRETGRGRVGTSLDGGGSGSLVVSIAAGGSAQVGVEREVLNGDYAFDDAALFAGNPDGSNVTTLAIDGANAGESVMITLQFGDATECVGLFNQLPDTGSGGTWPTPDGWFSNLLLTTDGNGDALGYLVARPGTTGHFVDLLANGAGLAATGSGQLLVRVAGVASLLAGGEL